MKLQLYSMLVLLSSSAFAKLDDGLLKLDNLILLKAQQNHLSKRDNSVVINAGDGISNGEININAGSVSSVNSPPPGSTNGAYPPNSVPASVPPITTAASPQITNGGIWDDDCDEESDIFNGMFDFNDLECEEFTDDSDLFDCTEEVAEINEAEFDCEEFVDDSAEWDCNEELDISQFECTDITETNNPTTPTNGQDGTQPNSASGLPGTNQQQGSNAIRTTAPFVFPMLVTLAALVLTIVN